MPEGPEVTHLTRYIAKHCQGRTLTKMAFNAGRYVNHEPPANFSAFQKALPMRCTKVTNKGKVIFMHFEHDWCLVSKLGMTGWWYVPGDEPSWKSSNLKNAVLDFGASSKSSRKSSNSNNKLIYTDFRSYGTIRLTKDPVDIQNEIARLAPDFLSEQTDWNQFKNRIAQLSQSKQKLLLEDALVDQQLIVSGIGNYLKSEILYAAKISPLRKIQDTSTSDWKRIFMQAKKIMNKMMAAVAANNVDEYANQMEVYHRTTDKRGNPVKHHKTKAGRMTFWVPAVQV